MNRHELILEFTKANLDLIMSEDFSFQVFQEKRRTFFTEARRGHGQGVPSNKEIAGEALNYQIRIGRISTEQELSGVLQLPFFSKYVRNRDLYYESLRIRKRTTPVTSLGKIGSLDAEMTAGKLKRWQPSGVNPA